MADDYTPYRCRSGDYFENDVLRHGKEINVLEFRISWSTDDWSNFEFIRDNRTGLRSITDVFDNYKGDLDYMRAHLDWGVWTLTFHPQVSGRGHRMIFMENLIKYCSSFDDVFFPTHRRCQIPTNITMSSLFSW